MRVLAGCLVVLTLATEARAQSGDVTAARDAYDRGAASYDAGEYGLATAQLARADALVPNDVALELALKASVKANDPIAAMELAARADGRRSPTLLSARDEARARMGGRVGRVTVSCPARVRCTATLDDGAFPVGETRWVLAGPHAVVVATEGGARQRYAVQLDPGATVPVQAASTPPAIAPVPEASPPLAPVARAASGGASPIWFWLGAGLTAAAAGATIASGIDTQNKHDAFAERPSASLSADGVDAQLRTNLLLAGTAAAAVATAALGLFVVRWGPGGASERTTRGAR